MRSIASSSACGDTWATSAAGGGPDKAMIARLKDVPLKSRVRLEWTFEERPRVEKIEVLKSGAPPKK